MSAEELNKRTKTANKTVTDTKVGEEPERPKRRTGAKLNSVLRTYLLNRIDLFKHLLFTCILTLHEANISKRHYHCRHCFVVKLLTSQ